MKDLKTLKTMVVHLLTILNGKQRIQMVGMMFIILVGSMFELLGVSAMLPFIQAFLAPDELAKKPYISFFARMFNVSSPDSVLLMVGIGIVIVYIVKNVYLSFSSYLQIKYSYSIKRQMALLMLKSFIERPYSFFVENGSGVILRGVGSDIDGVYHVIFNIFKLAVEGFVVVVISGYLFLVDSYLAVGVLIIGLLCLAMIVLGVKKKLTKLSIDYRESSASIGKFTAQINSGIKDIKVFGRSRLFLDSYDKAYEKANEAATKSDFAGLLPERIIEGTCISGIILMTLLRLGMGADANDFVPKMAVFAMGAFRLLPSISRITGYISVLIYSRPMLEATYDNIMAAKQTVKEQYVINSENTGSEPHEFTSVLEIRNLTWKYPQGNKNVLDDLNLTIKKGEAVGIIGASGAGKSTLADILLRLYKPQAGGIFMDGTDIFTIPDAWPKIMSYVPQNIFLMDDTIRANVVFGADKAEDADVWEALERASLVEFVKSLPDGLDTIVGERGVKFSGGQRQRIAIARALFIRPQIMILDEATSALDNETEQAVMEAIDSLAGSVTLIIIAHRLTTLRNCDRIFEISAGKALEQDKKTLLETENQKK